MIESEKIQFIDPANVRFKFGDMLSEQMALGNCTLKR